MERQWFIFYSSFYEAISNLPAENQLELYNAIASYSFTFVEPELSWISKVVWVLIKPQLDANSKRFLDWCKGGRPKKETTGLDEKITTGFENEKPKEKEKEKIKDKEKIKEKEKDNNHPMDEFDEALNEFVLMRKKIKKPITDKWIDLIKSKLNEMYPDDKQLQIKCLYKSIENSRQWVFALSEQDIKWYSPPWKKRFIPPDPNKILSLNEL